MKRSKTIETVFAIAFILWTIIFFSGIGIILLFDWFLPYKMAGIFCLGLVIFVIYSGLIND